MGTDNSGRFSSRQAGLPFAAAPPLNPTPYSSTTSVLGSESSSNSRPAAIPPITQTNAPFSSEIHGFRPNLQPRLGSPLVPQQQPQPVFVPPTQPGAPGPLPRFPTPVFSSRIQPPPSYGPPQPGSPNPMQPQIRAVPMGSPPPTQIVRPASSSILPPYPSPAPILQSSLPGYPPTQLHTGPPVSYTAATTAPYPSLQPGYTQYAPGMGHARSNSADVGSGHGLVEEFNSLSIGAIPGSLDTGLDPNALPRPFDGDVEPNSLPEMFHMNCSSKYFRLSTSAIPNSQSLFSRWHLPFGAVVCPLAVCPKEEEVPIINFASTGIIRCRRCRTYVNPFVVFTDGGRKWRCNMCSLLNEVPGDYFSHLDSNGRRLDLDRRPELTMGSVEFVAPTEYMVRPPMPPLYFFLIDVSEFAVRSGMLEVVAETIRGCLDDLPGFPRTQIGFITFDSTIHFYNLKSSLTQPQMLVISDLDEVFVPLPDDLLVNLSDSRTVVDTLLDCLPSMFQDNHNIESAFGPALKAAFMITHQLGGKLLIFQNTLPSLGVGRLRLRGDDVRVYGTDKEHTLRIPEDPFYKQMAADLTKYQIGVNVYAFSDKYMDIASLGTLAKYTGGQVYYYPAFKSSLHGAKLRHELSRDLTKETAWEAVMRIRCGKGVRFTTYHGNFMLRSTDLLALPAVDCDKAFAMQLCLEETILTTTAVYFQVALLYTSSSGERRIRVHTAAAPVVSDLGEMYRQADTGVIVSLFTRLAIEKTMSHKLEDARNSVQLRIVKAFREYRNLYAVQHRLGGRLIYPESLKFLPLYGLALCKSAPLHGGYSDILLDQRCASGFTIMALPVKRLLKLLYPTFIRIDEYLMKGSTQSDDIKNTLRRLPLTAEGLDSRGLFVFDDGFRFIIWFGRMLPQDIALEIIGVDFSVDFSKVRGQGGAREGEKKRRVGEVLKGMREEDPSYYQLCNMVRQGEKHEEGLLLSNLVEDHGVAGSPIPGYVDWTLLLHRQVQQTG